MHTETSKYQSETDKYIRTYDNYNAMGQAQRIEDFRGNINTRTYNNMGLLESKTSPGGITTSYSYDVKGREILRKTKNRSVATTWNLLNVKVNTTITDEYGSYTDKQYSDASGRITRVDNGGDGLRQIERWYDIKGRVITESYPGGLHISVQYAANGKVKRRIQTAMNLINNQTLSRTNEMEYDVLGRKTTETLPDGTKVTWQYATNNIGDVILTRTLKTRGNQKTLVTTDNFGREIQTTLCSSSSVNLTSLEDPESLTTRTVYNESGLLVKKILPDNRTNKTQYDSRGLVIQTVNAEGETTDMTYDAAGHLTVVTNRFGQVTIYTYDKDGRKISATAPDDGTIHITYNDYGQETSRTSAEGVKTFTFYDAKGRLRKKSNALGGSMTYTYNTDGERTETKRSDSVTTTWDITYSTNGKVINIHTPGNRESGENITTLYINGFGETNLIVNAYSLTNEQSYDALGRLTMTVTRDITNRYFYDAEGHFAASKKPNGLILTNLYNLLGQKVGEASITNGIVVKTNTYSYDNDGHLANSFSYSGLHTVYRRDKLVRVTARYEQYEGETQYHAFYTAYTTESHHKIIETEEAIVTSTNIAVTEAQNKRASKKIEKDFRGNTLYVWHSEVLLTENEYDNDGNLTQKIRHLKIGKNQNEVDSVTTFGYQKGMLVSKTLPSGLTLAFGYDVFGHKVTEKRGERTVHYTYYPSGKLHTKQGDGDVDLEYFYDSLSRLSNVTDNKSKLVRTSVYDDLGRLTAEIESQGTLTNAKQREYDRIGRVVRTIVNTVTNQTVYNLLGGKIVDGRIGKYPLLQRYFYNTRGLLTNTTSSNSPERQVVYVYNARGQLSNTIYPDGSSEMRSYNLYGELMSKSDRYGKTTSFSYDNYGRVTNQQIITPFPLVPKISQRPTESADCC